MPCSQIPAGRRHQAIRCLTCCLPSHLRRRLPRQFDVGTQSHSLQPRCLRFAARVTPAPRKTRFRLAANLDRMGLDTHRTPKMVSVIQFIHPPSPSFPSAQVIQAAVRITRPQPTDSLTPSGSRRPALVHRSNSRQIAPASDPIHLLTANETGIPSSAVRLRMLHASRASTDCASDDVATTIAPPTACASTDRTCSCPHHATPRHDHRVRGSTMPGLRAGKFTDGRDVARPLSDQGVAEATQNPSVALPSSVRLQLPVPRRIVRPGSRAPRWPAMA